MRLKLGTLMLGMSAGSAALAQTCTPTAAGRHDDAGATWPHHNDDDALPAGLGARAADQATCGRVYAGGNCRGVVYGN